VRIGLCSNAQQNLIETYVALASSISPTIIQWEGNVCSAISEITHPVCNFGIAFDLRREQVDALSHLSIQRQNFAVYALDQMTVESLEWGDFRQSHYLVQMEAPPGFGGSTLRLMEAFAPGIRSSVAQFMIEQFFPRQTAEFRFTLAQATAKQKALRLMYLPIEGTVAAAVMLHRTRGTTGLYNLCVATEYRHEGLGAQLVQWCRSQSDEPIVLQCNPNFVSWYQGLEFEQTGTVRAYCR
jgi:hypothetical protein